MEAADPGNRICAASSSRGHPEMLASLRQVDLGRVGFASHSGVIRPLATFDDPFGIVEALAFGEVVGINALHFIDLRDRDADVVVDHEFRQLVTVDEDDLAV
jgi:hypothetical protein